MMPVLQLEGVVKKYRRGDEQVNVLVVFDFTLDAGEFVVVNGPSGAGSRPFCISPVGWMRRTPACTRLRQPKSRLPHRTRHRTWRCRTAECRMTRTPRPPSSQRSPSAIISSAQTMCPSKPSDSAIAR